MLKGLAKDGLASASGVPKKLSDLALFIYLNNSRMVGPQKFAEPLFNYLARRAINLNSFIRFIYGINKYIKISTLPENFRRTDKESL